MKNKEIIGNYESPHVEMIEVLVEIGFAASGDVDDYDYGGNLNSN